MFKNFVENVSEFIKQKSVLDTFHFQDSMINAARSNEIFPDLHH